MRSRIGLLLLCALAVRAQDAGQVLSTSVGYGTMMASTAMAPEKMDQVVKLRQEAMVASRAGRHGEALKHLHHGMALMRGLEWTPAVVRAASLSLKADHSIWEEGDSVRLRFEKMYEPEASPPEAVAATVTLRSVQSGTTVPLRQWTLNGSKLETTVDVPRVAPGKYRLEVVVPPVQLPKTLSISVEPGLRKRVDRLRSRLLRVKSGEGPGLWTALYAVELFEQADRATINPTNFDFDRELTWGEQVTAALEARQDPFAGRVGDLRRAYRSGVDRTLQPYRVYVPSSYKPDGVYPLVVALHGMGGDENSLFDRYGNHVFQEQAEKYGWFVVAPKGREPASMYRDAAERDVMDVLAEVRAAYRVDSNRIYMMGHSMGGYGTWSIAANYPDVFAALGPIAGGGNPAIMQRIKHIPQIVFHGDNDKTVPVRMSRVMVEAGRGAEARINYVEVAGGGHVDIAAPAVPKIFEYFSRQSKP